MNPEFFNQIDEGCYQSNAEIWDFMDQIDNDSIDIVFTDPPYPLGKVDIASFSNSKKYKTGDHYQQLTKPDLVKFCSLLFDKMKDDSALFLMTNRDNRSFFEEAITEAGFSIKNELVWVKITGFDQGMAMGANYLNGIEYIIYAAKGKMPKINDAFNVYVKESPNRGRNSKPECLYAYFLNPVIKKMEQPIIVDPFGGSDPLTRAKMRGLIHSCITISNVKITGDKTDPAVDGLELRSQNLNRWIKFNHH